MSDEPVDPMLGISRRRVLRRGAAAGSVLVWTVPVMQTIAGPAVADDAGSPPPDGKRLRSRGPLAADTPDEQPSAQRPG